MQTSFDTLVRKIFCRVLAAKCEPCTIMMPVAKRRSRNPKQLVILFRGQIWRRGLARGGEPEPIICFCDSVAVRGCTPVGRFTEMTSDEFCFRSGKQIRSFRKE